MLTFDRDEKMMIMYDDNMNARMGMLTWRLSDISRKIHTLLSPNGALTPKPHITSLAKRCGEPQPSPHVTSLAIRCGEPQPSPHVTSLAKRCGEPQPSLHVTSLAKRCGEPQPYLTLLLSPNGVENPNQPTNLPPHSPNGAKLARNDADVNIQWILWINRSSPDNTMTT